MVYRYRPKADRWALGVAALVYGALLLGGVADGAWIATGVLTALIATAGYRFVTTRVVTSQDGVLIRNVWRTHRLAWERVDHFSLVTAEVGRNAFPDTGVAICRDGREVPMHGVALARISGGGEREAVAHLIAQLNAETKQRAAGSTE